MLVGYMRVSSDSDRQTTDLQRDALLAAGIDGRHLFEDYASGAKDDRPGLVKALAVGADAELTQEPEIIDPVERTVTRCVQRGFKGRRWSSENQRRGSIRHQRQQ